MIRQGLRALLLLGGPAAMAQTIALDLPIACDLGVSCFIQQYVDRDPGPGARDHRCGPLSYDGHTGTDFGLSRREMIADGIPVRAAAAGVVRATRDGMEDTGFSPLTAADIAGRECGNGVTIEHVGDWQTQYCHLRQGSVAVLPGQGVAAGTHLGEVGQSGRAAFAHLHFTLRHNGNIVDPFAPETATGCDAQPHTTLWRDAPPYRAGGLLRMGITDHIPEYEAVKQGTLSARPLTGGAPHLVVFAHGFGMRAGDVLHLRLTGPGGEIVAQGIEITRTQAQSYRAVGRKRRRDWPAGLYTGHAELRRGAEVVGQMSVSVRLR